MSARKKSTRRNTGGRRSETPPISIKDDTAQLERGMMATSLAMNVARQVVRQPNWWSNVGSR